MKKVLLNLIWGKKMLQVLSLAAGYGKRQVLYGVNLQLKAKEIVGIIGQNGSGKSTLVKSIFGLIPLWGGQVFFKGEDFSKKKPLEKVKNGMVYLPQGNRVFPRMSVFDNLRISSFFIDDNVFKERVQEVFSLFPVLWRRRKDPAYQLSGGEQQFLALGRAFILSPDILILDEPSLGLSPGFVNKIFSKIKEMVLGSGLGVLIVEQKVNALLPFCDRIYALKLGKVLLEGEAIQLSEDIEIFKKIFL